MSVSTIDLSTPPANHHVSVKVEREESLAERNVRLAKDFVLFMVAIGFVVTIAVLCVRSVLDTATSAEERKWSMSVLSAMAGGLIGYLVKR